MRKHQHLFVRFFIVLLFSYTISLTAWAVDTQSRIDHDIEAGKPIVIQLSVALADNKNQGIVPVPKLIGNGQDPHNNLYWGARYGIKTYMLKDAGWQKVASLKPDNTRILERLILKKSFKRKGQTVPVYLVADAWDGKHINQTIRQFMRYNAGEGDITISLDDKNNTQLAAGAQAHLIAYIGHNALMDYKKFFLQPPVAADNNPDNDTIILACKSKPYFEEYLPALSTHPLVLTTGLMAPEAYSFHAAIQQWVAGKNDITVRKAAARSYSKYQKTSRKAAERLFDALMVN